jgi:hypothetical protein
MASTSEPLTTIAPAGEASKALASQWRRLIRAATFIAVLTSPIPFLFFYVQQEWPLGWALLATFGLIIAYRGLLDIVMRRLIPWPSLFGADEERLREEDVVNRRRAWFWSKRWRFIYLVALFITISWLILELIPGGEHTWWGTATAIPENIIELVQNPAIWIYIVIFPLLFLVNFLILMGPLMLMGITQIQSFEPGDADWGVKLEDVRGQAEAKEEVRWPAASASAGSSSSARPGPARRCSRRRSRPGSTARSSPSPAPGSRRRSSGWTPSSSGISPGRRRSSPASGAASASSSSTRSTPWACAARASGLRSA